MISQREVGRKREIKNRRIKWGRSWLDLLYPAKYICCINFQGGLLGSSFRIQLAEAMRFQTSESFPLMKPYQFKVIYDYGTKIEKE
jgi:hypothetical protein